MLKSYRLLRSLSFELIAFSLSFVSFKLLAFIVPLFLVNQLAPEDFVDLESGLAISNIMVIFLNLGVSAAIPLYLLRENKKHDIAYVYLHGVAASILMLLLAIVTSATQGTSKWIFVFLTVSMLCNLRIISIHKKTEALPIQASFYEVFIFVVLLACLFFALVVESLSLSKINTVFFGAAILVLAISIRAFSVAHDSSKALEQHKFKNLYSFSSISLFASTIIILVITLIRAFGDNILTTDEYLAYSIYFRLSSIAIIAFQFIITLKFKKLYSSSSDSIDRATIYISVCVFAIALFIHLSSSFSVPILFSPDVENILNRYTEIAFPVLLSMPLWAVSAILENIVARERAFKQMLAVMCLFLALFIGLLFYLFLINALTISVLVYAHVLLICMLISSQVFALRRKGLVLVRIQSFVAFAVLLGVVGASFSIK